MLQHGLQMQASGKLDWLLELADCAVTYRARYRAEPEWLPVLDLLLLDQSNTRSVAFQLEGIVKSLGKIRMAYGVFGNDDLPHLQTELFSLDADTDLVYGNTRLADLLGRLQAACAATSEHISLHFFSYTGERHALGRQPSSLA